MSTTDVSASEHNKHEETEQETRKRKVAGNVKVKGRERELAGRPQVEHKKKKRAEKDKGK